MYTYRTGKYTLQQQTFQEGKMDGLVCNARTITAFSFNTPDVKSLLPKFIR